MAPYVLLSLIFLGLQSSAFADCLNGWVPHDGHCYLFAMDEQEGWASAQTICRLYGAFLAEVETPAEEKFLLSEVHHRSGTGGSKVWLGANDIAVEGEWRWVRSGFTFSQTGYQNWNPGEPTNHQLSNRVHENCLDFNKDGSGQWNDELCSLHQSFICERSPETNTEGLIG